MDKLQSQGMSTFSAPGNRLMVEPCNGELEQSLGKMLRRLAEVAVQTEIGRLLGILRM